MSVRLSRQQLTTVAPKFWPLADILTGTFLSIMSGELAALLSRRQGPWTKERPQVSSPRTLQQSLSSTPPQGGCGWSCIRGCIEGTPLPAALDCRGHWRRGSACASSCAITAGSNSPTSISQKNQGDDQRPNCCHTRRHANFPESPLACCSAQNAHRS